MKARTDPRLGWALVALLLALSTAGLQGCGTKDEPGGETAEAEAPRLTIYTSCFPIDWLTRRVAGEHADVVHILPAGEDPPEWTPPADVVTKMQDADLIVINGATFEGWARTITLPEGKVVDTTAGLKDQLITIEGTTHSHGKGGEHTHEGTDPHTWVDPLLASTQAEAIRDALVRADSAHAEAYRANFEALKTDLQGLHDAYQEACAGYTGELMATSHPAFNYIGRRYGWKLANFGFEPDEEPDAHQLEHLAEHVKDDGVRLMLWESMPGDELEARFEATGVQVVFLDPLEQPPDGGTYDYLTQGRANVETLRQLFAKVPDAASTERGEGR